MPRPLAEADVPAVVELVNEATPEHPVNEAEVRTWLTNPVRDIEFALFDRDGRVAAYADVAMPEEAPDRAWLDMRVPERSLADDLVDEILAWSEGLSRARDRTLLRAFVGDRSPLADQLERRGYRPIRFSFHMRIDLRGRPTPPRWPEGVTVDSVRPGEERVAYEVSQEAFADHWEFAPTSWEEWSHWMLGEDFDPELWVVARDRDEMAGVCLCRAEAVGRPGVGWVRILGVRRPWRRRGLGRALLLESFRRFHERGATAVGLGVDGENTTGAVRLYESVGMYVEHRLDIYEGRL